MLTIDAEVGRRLGSLEGSPVLWSIHTRASQLLFLKKKKISIIILLLINNVDFFLTRIPSACFYPFILLDDQVSFLIIFF